MKLDTRLVSPKVYVLVEVPVYSFLEIFPAVVPVFSAKSLPDFLLGHVVLEVFICQSESYLNFCLRHAIVHNLER